MHTVFVYGTLKRGHGNNHLLIKSEFIGEARTKESYALFQSGIPFCVPKNFTDAECFPVTGELWGVDDHTLNCLDSLEGHPDFYTRQLITVQSQGEEIQAYIYEYHKNPRTPYLCESVDGHYKY